MKAVTARAVKVGAKAATQGTVAAADPVEKAMAEVADTLAVGAVAEIGAAAEVADLAEAMGAAAKSPSLERSA